MQFFAQVVVDVAADPVERSAEASGTVVIPFPGGSGSGTGSGTGGSDGTGETSDEEVLKMMRQGMKLEILPGMRIQGVRMMSLVARIPDPEPGVVRRFLWM